MSRSFELVEYHDFEPDEQLLTREARERLAPIPFEWERAQRQYVQHLPVSHRPEVIYPWRDRGWQGEWLWRVGGLEREEAYFWFAAMTHPLRHEETQLDVRVPQALWKEWSEQPWAHVEWEWASERVRCWFEAERVKRSEVRWFAYSYLTRLLMELFEVGEVLALLMSVIPASEVRHFFVHLEAPDEPDEALTAQIAAIAEQVDVTRSESDVYTVIRLLESLPQEDIAQRLCERLSELSSCSGTLVRDAVNLLEDRAAFARWFNTLETYHLAQEMVPSLVLRGGFEVVEALMRRVVRHDDAFVGVAFKDLLRLHSWRCVAGFLELAQRKMFSAASRDWIVSNGEHSARGLCSVWLDGSHARSRDAKRLLEEMCARGHLEEIARHASAESDPARRARIQDELIAYYE